MQSCVVVWIIAGWSNECKVVWSSGLQQAGQMNAKFHGDLGYNRQVKLNAKSCGHMGYNRQVKLLRKFCVLRPTAADGAPWQ